MSIPTVGLLSLAKKDFDKELMDVAGLGPDEIAWIKHHALDTVDVLRDNAAPDGMGPPTVALALLLALFLVGRLSSFDRGKVLHMIEELWPKLDNIAARMADEVTAAAAKQADAPLVEVLQ